MNFVRSSDKQRISELLCGERHFSALQSDEMQQAAASFQADADKVKTIRRLIVVAVASLFCALALSPLAGLIVSAIAGGIVLLTQHSAAMRRMESFEKDYPAFLLSLASSIRTGLDPLAALLGLTALFPKKNRLGFELALLAQNIERGVREDEAIKQFARSVPHPDIGLFRSAFILSRQQGSSLGECLERLARVTRARQSFRRKARAAVAMQRLSAFGIAVCAVLIGLMQFVANSDAMKTAYHHPIGSKLLALGAFLVVAGLLWMLGMSRNKL